MAADAFLNAGRGGVAPIRPQRNNAHYETWPSTACLHWAGMREGPGMCAIPKTTRIDFTDSRPSLGMDIDSAPRNQTIFKKHGTNAGVALRIRRPWVLLLLCV